MADLVDFDLINAALLLLRADTGPPALVVYPDANGVTPPTPTPPYVRVYSSIERPPDAEENNLGGASGSWTVRWYCHCVGGNEYAAGAVAMRVRAALLDVRPTVTGRSCGLIRHDASQPARPDADLGYQVMDQVDVYRMTSTPA